MVQYIIKNQINEALKSADPYSIVPSYDVIEHGTHVARNKLVQVEI